MSFHNIQGATNISNQSHHHSHDTNLSTSLTGRFKKNLYLCRGGPGHFRQEPPPARSQRLQLRQDGDQEEKLEFYNGTQMEPASQWDQNLESA